MSTLIIACGAIAREVRAILPQLNALGEDAPLPKSSSSGLTGGSTRSGRCNGDIEVDPSRLVLDHPVKPGDEGRNWTLRCVPAELHNRPEQIAPAVEAILQGTDGQYHKTLIAFGDCGTQGALDRLCAERGIDRLPGAHCYAFFAGEADFNAMMAEEPGTFFLTDFLARQFDAFVTRPLGLDRFPHLRDDYFGHYSRLVFLSQTEDPALLARARAAADQLGLRFEHRPTGLHPFARELARLAVPIAA